MSIAAMKQALDTLEEINKLSIGENAICLPAEIDTAMDSLRQAIEQAEQAQSVAHSLVCVCGALWDIKADGSEEMVHTPDVTPQRQPLTHPQIHEFDWPEGVSFEEILPFVRLIEDAHGIKGEA